MSYSWMEHVGLYTVLVDGKPPRPFLYINGKDAPPWVVEPIRGKSFKLPSLEAAQFALILALNHQGESK